ncbi:MAG: YciI family protein [Isosphaeraceae bacterium]|nr:YciI family protein [Isosphaeraceae bacterium]
MKYAVLVYEGLEDYSARTDSDRAGAYWGAYRAYSSALREAGVAAGGTALEPPDRAVSIRIRDEKRTVHDGPFADTKEQLGGMFLIDVPDLETALEWAARCPAAAWGAVEVRPVLVMGSDSAQ